MEWTQDVINFLKSDTVLIIIGALYVLIEYFLGKTDLVKPGSVLEAVLLGFIKVFEALGLVKKEEPKINS